jgi:AhpD family alkylhydroperoxidase
MGSVLPPIERPRGLLMRIAYAASKRQYGVVLSALKVIYARKPSLALVARKILSAQNKLTLELPLRALIQVQVSRLNGCRFCEDIRLATAYKERVGAERFLALESVSTSTLFTAREKAALALTAEATTQRKVSEATWREAKRHFSETELVEIVWLNASENYFNLQAAVLGIESDGLAEPFDRLRAIGI